MFVLHDHQRAGTKVAPAFAGRHRTDRSRECRTGAAFVFYNGRQFCAEQGLGSDPRPAHPPARNREAEYQLYHPGRHACHKLPGFIEKCKRAGVKRVFIGLENINPDSLLGAKKRQNKITDYRQMLLAWKEGRIVTYCGYILGFPGDTRESILHDIEVIKRELPVDLLEFFYLTPLPGSEDHKGCTRPASRWTRTSTNTT